MAFRQSTDLLSGHHCQAIRSAAACFFRDSSSCLLLAWYKVKMLQNLSPTCTTSPVSGVVIEGWCSCRTPLAAGVAQNFVNLSLDILLVVALGVGVVSFHGLLSACSSLVSMNPSPS